MAFDAAALLEPVERAQPFGRPRIDAEVVLGAPEIRAFDRPETEHDPLAEEGEAVEWRVGQRRFGFTFNVFVRVDLIAPAPARGSRSDEAVRTATDAEVFLPTPIAEVVPRFFARLRVVRDLVV